MHPSTVAFCLKSHGYAKLILLYQSGDSSVPAGLNISAGIDQSRLGVFLLMSEAVSDIYAQLQVQLYLRKSATALAVVPEFFHGKTVLV